MRLDSLSKHFESMGARVKFGEIESPRWWGDPASLRAERWRREVRRRLPTFTVDISDDKKGQYFDIRIKKDRDIGLQILQAMPKQRHLLMMTSRGRRPESPQMTGTSPSRCTNLLCDESHRQE